MACQVCSSKTKEILDLGHHPPSDRLLSKDDMDKEEAFYPLKLVFCENCKLAQLTFAVDPNLLFTDKFVYRTAFNNSLKSHFKELVDAMVKKLNLGRGSFAVDIGSNDGTLLKNYLEHGIKILGVDPSVVADIASKEGVPTVKDFFNASVAKSITSSHGKADIVTGTNVFAHVKDLQSLMEGIREMLKDNGVFLQESHYFMDMVEKLQYDEIYLEHLRYYSLESLINLFEKFGMDVFHAERVGTHGGSIMSLACIKGNRKIEDSVKNLLAAEKKSGISSDKVMADFRQRVFKNGQELRALISKVKSDGGRIAAIGAPAKGNTILNFCKLDYMAIDYAAEKSDLKIGKFTPGMHIPIVSEERLLLDRPEYALLLSWNLKEELVPKLRKLGYMGKIIIPNPKVELV